MKNKIIAFLCAAIIAVTFSGCESITFNVLELMSPPKATGDKAEIQELIDKEAGTEHTLKYPQNGNYRSAITTMDIDADNVEEAVAFYLPAGDAQTVHLLIMDTVNGVWTVVGNHVSKSSTVDRLEFADLDGDGIKEIAVGWSTYNTLINDLSVYLLDNGESREITSQNTYSSLICDDFTTNKKDELLLLSLFTPDKPATASLVTLNDTKNSLYTVSSTDIDADVTSFAQLLTGKISDEQFGAVIDGVTTSGAYSTQLVYYNNNSAELCSIKFTKDEPTNQAVRNYNVLSKDVDDDGIIEIPNTFKMPSENTQTDTVPAALIYWCEYTASENLRVDITTATSLVYGFYFSIPQSWEDNYTAYVNYSTNEVIFYEWTDKDTLGETLLIIKMFTQKAWNDNVSSAGYTKLAQNDSYVYSFVTPESNSSKLLTNEEVQEAFTLS